MIEYFHRHMLSFLLFVLMAVLAIGTAGYQLIEGWSLLDSFYMAVITLTTIGFGEVKELSPHGRMFTLILIVFGLVLVAFIINYTTEQIIRGQLSEILGFQARQRIRRMTNHFIVCGFGRMGEKVCEQLRQARVPFVVIDSDLERYQDATELGYHCIHGDSTDDEILDKAQIQCAKGLVCSVSSDAQNVFITLSARQMNADLYILARAVEDNSVQKLVMAGASKVVSPYTIGGRTMANALLRPHVVEFVEFATDNEALDFGLESVLVAEESEFNGLNLMESQIRSKYNVMILSIRKHDGREMFNPSSTTIIEAGDQLILAGHPTQLHELICAVEATDEA